MRRFQPFSRGVLTSMGLFSGRHVISLGALCETTEALTAAQESGATKKPMPSLNTLKDFCTYHRIEYAPSDASNTEEIEKRVLRFLSTCPQSAEALIPEGSLNSLGQFTGSLPIYLLSFDEADSNVCNVLCPFTQKIIVSGNFKDEDSQWKLVQRLVQYGGKAAGIFLTTSRKFAKITPVFNTTLAEVGYQAHCHVSLLDLIALFNPEADGETKTTVPSASTISKSRGDTSPFAPFRELSMLLQTHFPGLSEVQAVHHLIIPNAQVFVCDMSRNDVFWSVTFMKPESGMKVSSTGNIEDVVTTLLQKHEHHNRKDIILFPSGKVNDILVFALAKEIRRTGSRVAVVFPRGLRAALKKLTKREPSQMWKEICKLLELESIDVLVEILKVAGKFNRGEVSRAISKLSEGGGERPDMVLPEDCSKWLDNIYARPPRLEAEATTAKSLERFICFSYLATANAACRRAANPTAQENFLITLGLQDYKGNTYLPLQKMFSRQDLRVPSLDDYDVIVTDGGKDLVLYVWANEEVQKFLKRGGKIWCVRLAEYLLSGMVRRESALQLHNLAALYQTDHLPEHERKARMGISNARLGLDKHRYIHSKQLTALSQIFPLQVAKGQRQSQLISLVCRMDAMLMFAHIEHVGLQISSEEAAIQSKTAVDRLAEVDNLLKFHLPDSMPLDLRSKFNWGLEAHLRALFYGGVITLGRPAFESNMGDVLALVEVMYSANLISELIGDPMLQAYARERGISVSGNPHAFMDSVAQYLKKHLPKFRLIVFDLESTGLDGNTDEIVECAFYDPVSEEIFSSLVKPEQPIPVEVRRIHNISPEMVAEAPTFAELAPSLFRFLRLDSPDEKVILIAHNSGNLDEPLLRNSFKRCGFEVDQKRIVFCDTLPLFKHIRSVAVNKGNNYLKSLKLGDLQEELNVRLRGDLHRAETDAKVLWDCLCKSLDCLDQRKNRRVEFVLRAMAKCVAAYRTGHCFSNVSHVYGDVIRCEFPGLINQLSTRPNTADLAVLNRGKSELIDDQILTMFARYECKVADLLKLKRGMEARSTSFLELDEHGQLPIVHKDGKVRQEISLTATATSRTTSSNPNCQSIPKHDKSNLRKIFVSRFGDEGICVEIDYSQLEILVNASLCKDPKLIADLQSGVDLHLRRVQTFCHGMTYDELLRKHKEEKDPDIIALRKKAKIMSFQRLYGAGVTLMSKTSNMSREVLEAMLADEERQYPGISAFHKLVQALLFRRDNPGRPHSYILELPTGCRVSFLAKDAERNLPPVKNYPVQAFGAELVQIATGELWRMLHKLDFFNDRAFIVNYVHDSIWLDCHKDVADVVVPLGKEVLESLPRIVSARFPGLELECPFAVTVAAGKDMLHMEDVDDYPKGSDRMKSNVNVS